MPGDFFHFLQSYDEVQDYLTYVEEEDPSYIPEDEGDEMYSGDESEEESDSFDETDDGDPEFVLEVLGHEIIAQSGYVNEQEPMEERVVEEFFMGRTGSYGSSGNAAMDHELDSAERLFTNEVLSAVEQPFGIGQSGAINQREGGGLSSTMEFVVVGESAERHRDTAAAPSEAMVDTDTSFSEYETDCPICYNSWDDDGPHQSCSLSCGHTFGRSCIEKWIRDRKKAICPNCKRRCKLADIRPIYPKRIAVIDSVLKKKVESLDEENKRLKRQIQEKDSMLEATQKELEESRKQMVVSLSDSVPLVETQRKLFHFGDRRKDCEIEYISQSSTRNLLKFVGKQEFGIDGARVFDMVSSEQIMLLARRVSSGESVLTKISLLFANENENIKLPPCYKAIRDISVSHSIEKLALLASMGNKLSVVSWKSNNIVLQYDLPAPAWSCAWDLNGLHQVYAGLQNGMLMVFDLRQTRTHLHTLSGLSCHPVHTLHCLRSNEAQNAPSGRTALLSASASGLCQWTESGPCRIPNLENQGVCISLAYCGYSENIVATFRPKVQFLHDQNSQPSASTTPGSPVLGSHFHLKRDTNSYQNLGHVSAYVSEVRMPKSSVISLMDSNPLFAHGNEGSRGVRLRELPSLHPINDLPPHECPILDVKCASSNGIGLLGSVSENKVQVFSITC